MKATAKKQASLITFLLLLMMASSGFSRTLDVSVSTRQVTGMAGIQECLSEVTNNENCTVALCTVNTVSVYVPPNSTKSAGERQIFNDATCQQPTWKCSAVPKNKLLGEMASWVPENCQDKKESKNKSPQKISPYNACWNNCYLRRCGNNTDTDLENCVFPCNEECKGLREP